MGSNPETGKVFSTQILILEADVLPHTLAFLSNPLSMLFLPRNTNVKTSFLSSLFLFHLMSKITTDTPILSYPKYTKNLVGYKTLATRPIRVLNSIKSLFPNYSFWISSHSV